MQQLHLQKFTKNLFWQPKNDKIYFLIHYDNYDKTWELIERFSDLISDDFSHKDTNDLLEWLEVKEDDITSDDQLNRYAYYEVPTYSDNSIWNKLSNGEKLPEHYILFGYDDNGISQSFRYFYYTQANKIPDTFEATAFIPIFVPESRYIENKQLKNNIINSKLFESICREASNEMSFNEFVNTKSELKNSPKNMQSFKNSIAEDFGNEKGTASNSDWEDYYNLWKNS